MVHTKTDLECLAYILRIIKSRLTVVFKIALFWCKAWRDGVWIGALKIVVSPNLQYQLCSLLMWNKLWINCLDNDHLLCWLPGVGCPLKFGDGNKWVYTGMTHWTPWESKTVIMVILLYRILYVVDKHSSSQTSNMTSTLYRIVLPFGKVSRVAHKQVSLTLYKHYAWVTLWIQIVLRSIPIHTHTVPEDHYVGQ